MNDEYQPGPLVCKRCGSERLISIRLDSDWGDGGDVTRVNDDRYYADGDMTDGDSRPDINIHHCEACGHQEG